MAFFSLIIPAYNVDEYIKNCLQSIRNQSFSDYEIIVVDDGSSDDTLKIVCSEKDIQVYSLEHKGVGEARNFGLSKATGTYVWFIDADDYLPQGCLKELHDILCRDNIDCCSFKYRKVWEKYSDANMTECLLKLDMVHRINGDNELFHFTPHSVAVLVFRRELAQGATFRSMSYCEDYLFALTIWSKCRTACHLDSELYYYYQRNNSSVHKMPPTVVDDFLEFSWYALKIAHESNRKALWDYVVFTIREMIVLCIMTYIYKNVENRKQKRELYGKMCKSLGEFHKVFNFPLDKHLQKIVTTQSYLSGCIWLYWRYYPRHYLAKHPFILKLFKMFRG